MWGLWRSACRDRRQLGFGCLRGTGQIVFAVHRCLFAVLLVIDLVLLRNSIDIDGGVFVKLLLDVFDRKPVAVHSLCVFWTEDDGVGGVP